MTLSWYVHTQSYIQCTCTCTHVGSHTLYYNLPSLNTLESTKEQNSPQVSTCTCTCTCTLHSYLAPVHIHMVWIYNYCPYSMGSAHVSGNKTYLDKSRPMYMYMYMCISCFFFCWRWWLLFLQFLTVLFPQADSSAGVQSSGRLVCTVHNKSFTLVTTWYMYTTCTYSVPIVVQMLLYIIFNLFSWYCVYIQCTFKLSSLNYKVFLHYTHTCA